MGLSTKRLLEDAICTEIQEISNFEKGSKERSETIKNVVDLYKLKIEEDKNEMEINEKRETRVDQNALDSNFKDQELNNQAKDRYIKLGIAAAEIILPLMFYATWMRRGFQFEETGTYTSSTFKGLFGRFRPTNK